MGQNIYLARERKRKRKKREIPEVVFATNELHWEFVLGKKILSSRKLSAEGMNTHREREKEREYNLSC